MDQEMSNFIRKYVNENIDVFHSTRLEKLRKLRLSEVLTRKNPYLFKAKNINSAADLIQSIAEATLYSSEETLFGKFLEGLAIYIAELTQNGLKSGITGIDLELTQADIRYVIAIKSGQNWGNSSQHQALRQNFKNAVKVIKQDRRIKAVQPVPGICYGKFKTIDTGEYLKIGGQAFWHFISGERDFHTDLIEPLGYRAREHNEEFLSQKDSTLNRLSREFMNGYCDESGRIDWSKLVAFNSANLTKEEVDSSKT